MAMMGERMMTRGGLLYEFKVERHVPAKHLLRSLDEDHSGQGMVHLFPHLRPGGSGV
jgi:hypothetical protein